MTKERLVLLITDQDGRVKYKGEKLNPFVFASTFIGSLSFFDRSDGHKRVRDCKVVRHSTDKSIDIFYDEIFDPLNAIELRKKGYRFHIDGDALGQFDLYKHIPSGDIGYLWCLERENLYILDRSNIRYRVVREIKPEKRNRRRG